MYIIYSVVVQIVIAAEADAENHFVLIDEDLILVHNRLASGSSSSMSRMQPQLVRSVSNGSKLSSGESTEDYVGINLCALEETIRTCLSLALLCRAKQKYAYALFERGLLKIMLRILTSTSEDVHRYALKCISSLCDVVTFAVDMARDESVNKVGLGRGGVHNCCVNMISSMLCVCCDLVLWNGWQCDIVEAISRKAEKGTERTPRSWGCISRYS